MIRVIPCIQVTKLIRGSESIRLTSRGFFPAIIDFNKITGNNNRGNWSLKILWWKLESGDEKIMDLLDNYLTSL